MLYENENKKVCSNCGCIIEDGTEMEHDEKYYCDDCVEEIFAICERCGELHLIEELIETQDGKLVCDWCLENHYTVCDDCGDYVENRYINTDSNGKNLCNNCCENYYYYCENCGEFVHVDDVYWDDNGYYSYCENCFNDLFANRVILEYGEKPYPIFYGEKNKRFFGLELEVDKGGLDNENAQCLLDIANENSEHIYIKKDCSLHDGFEIVTHPMDLYYHSSEMPWENLTKTCLNMGYLSHNTSTCGLHIHVNRGSLGKSYDEQENTIAKIVFLVESFWSEMVIFSRRDYEKVKRWADKYGKEKSVIEQKESCKNNRYDRYKAVNLCNSQTIEFRLFRGTLKFESILATLEMVDFLCDFSIRNCDAVIEKVTWKDIVSMLKENNDYNYIVDYLYNRGLM